MSSEAIVALRADREEALALASSLSDGEWASESGCAGWSVQDVYAHMTSYHHVTPAGIKAARSAMKEGIERVNDALVEIRSGLSPAQQLAEFDTWTRRGLTLLSAAQVFPVARIPVPLPDFGTVPLASLANALAFDTYTHLRFDLLSPRGPIERDPLPEDPMRLRPVMAWLLRAFPPLHAKSFDFLDAPIHLTLHGPGGGDWTIERQAGAKPPVTIKPGRRVPCAARIVSTTPEFVGWSTHRVDWRAADVEIQDDEELGARVLDAIYLY